MAQGRDAARQTGCVGIIAYFFIENCERLRENRYCDLDFYYRFNGNFVPFICIYHYMYS